MLFDEHQHRWQGLDDYFYADSGSSAGKFLNRIERADFSRWSVSYNKWTDKLDRLVAELPENQWRCAAARRPTPGTIHMGQTPTRGMRASGKVCGRAVEERGRPDVALRLYGLQA